MNDSLSSSNSCDKPLFGSLLMSVSRRSLCDLCRLGPIVGPHYRCSHPRCAELDMCVACVTTVKHPHHGCFYMVAGVSELMSVMSPFFQQRLLPAVHSRFRHAASVKRLQSFYSSNQSTQEKRSASAAKAKKAMKGKLKVDSSSAVAHPFLSLIPPALLTLGRRAPLDSKALQDIFTGVRSVLQQAGMPEEAITESFNAIQGKRKANQALRYNPRRRNASARSKSRKGSNFATSATASSAPANSVRVTETLQNILAVIELAWSNTWEASKRMPTADESVSLISPSPSDASSPAPSLQAPEMSRRERHHVAVSAIMDHMISFLQRLEYAYLHATGLGSGSNWLDATDEEVAAASSLPLWLQQDDRDEYPSHAGLALLFWTWMGTPKQTAASCSTSAAASQSLPAVLASNFSSKQATITTGENDMFQVLLGEEVYDEFCLRSSSASTANTSTSEECGRSHALPSSLSSPSFTPSSPPGFHLCSGSMVGVGSVSMIPLTMMPREDKPPRFQSCPEKPLDQYMRQLSEEESCPPQPILALDGDNWSVAMERHTVVCVFVSHHWRQSGHPDPDGKDWRILQRWMWDTIAGVIDVLAILLVRAGLSAEQLHKWMTQPQGTAAQPVKFLFVEHHYREGVIDADMLTSLVRLTLTHLIRSQHRISTLESTAQRVSLCRQVAARIFFWFDYTCIPQKPRTQEQTIQFRHVLRHLASLQLSCSSTLVTNHAESDYDAYLRRAWCVAEWVLVDHCSLTHSLSSEQAADLIDALEDEKEGPTVEDEPAEEGLSEENEGSGTDHDEPTEEGLSEENEDSSTDHLYWRNPNAPLPTSLTTYRFQIRHAILFKMLRAVGSTNGTPHKPLPSPRDFLRDHMHLHITSVSKDENSNDGSSQSSSGSELGSEESAAELELTALAICRVLWTAACRYFNENDMFFIFDERMMDAQKSDEIILAQADLYGNPVNAELEHALKRLRWLVHATETKFRECEPFELPHSSNHGKQVVSSGPEVRSASVPASELSGTDLAANRPVDEYENGFQALPLICAYRDRVASSQSNNFTSSKSSQRQPPVSPLAEDSPPISSVSTASPNCSNKNLPQRTLRILFYTPLPADAVRFECDSRLWLTATIDILMRFATAVKDAVNSADIGRMLAQQYDSVHIGLTCSLLSKAKQRGDTILLGNSQDTGWHLIDFLVPHFGEGYELAED